MIELSRRQLLRGIAVVPVAVALGPALQPIITSSVSSTPVMMPYLTDPGAWFVVTDRGRGLATELIPGINRIFAEEYARYEPELEEIFA